MLFVLSSYCRSRHIQKGALHAQRVQPRGNCVYPTPFTPLQEHSHHQSSQLECDDDSITLNPSQIVSETCMERVSMS